MKHALLAALVLLASPALAAPDKKRAATEFAEGQRQFKAKAYVKAAAHFKAAYAADEDPAYLFNIAQALRHAKECAESRDYYRRFLATAAVVPNRDKVDAWLAEVEACVAAAKPIEPPPPDSVSVTPPPVDPRSPSPPTKPPTPTMVTAPTTNEEDAGRGRRRAGLLVVGGGAIAVGAGVLFTMRVNAAARDREALCPAPCTWNEDLDDRARSLDDKGTLSSTLAIASFAVGGAALVGGVVLYVTGRRASQERVTVTPVAGGAVARVGFEF